MDTISAYVRGQASRGNPSMVFDWDKAAQIIKDSGTKNASAGLSGDWEWTGGEIFTDGKPNPDAYIFLASTWATPELSTDDDFVDCFIMEDEARARWGDVAFAELAWPESALKILNGE